MNAKRGYSWLGHLVALLVLLSLDTYKRLRRIISKTFLRMIVGALGSGLLVMVLSSLLALRQITHSVESLVGDSLVGMESSVAMRSAVRETQLDLLRLQLNPDRRLRKAEVDDFNRRLRHLLARYRTGIFETEDEANAQRIERRLAGYLDSLQPIIDAKHPESVAVKVADNAARELVEAVEQAYLYNRQRIHLSADEAGSAARRALQISNRLWWSFALFVFFMLLIYLASRWLALPESQDA